MTSAERRAARWDTADTSAGEDSADELAVARRVADSVLYEGYVLFPYRASARKNQFRWQFGVVRPPEDADEHGVEPSEMAAEVLLTGGQAAEVEVRARFLRLRRRDVQASDGAGGYRSVERLDVEGAAVTAWDEGVECEIGRTARVGDLLAGEVVVPIGLPGDRDVEELDGTAPAPSPDSDARPDFASDTTPAPSPGGTDSLGMPRRSVTPPGAHARVVRTTAPLAAVMRLRAEPLDADRGLRKLRVEVANRTDGAGAGASRDEVLRRSLIGLHLLIRVQGGALLSVQDPPDWARAHADSLANRQLYPVLVGPVGSDTVMLASPIILYDHAEVAPESPGDSFDATEIDELLSLSVASLTDEEKREARATDQRAAEIIDRVEALPPQWQERLHGALRQPGTGRAEPTSAAADEPAPSDEFAEFFGVGEAPIERLSVGDAEIALGSLVRLRPLRRADAQDLFVDGRLARVQRIVTDVDGTTHVGVSLEDDPGAELHVWHGRFLYFQPDELVPEQEP